MESVYHELIAEVEYNRMDAMEKLFKKYENMEEDDDDIVDLSTMTIISKKKGKRKITEHSLERVYKKTERKGAPIRPYGMTSKGLKLMEKIESHVKSGGKIYGGRQPSSSMEPTFPVPWATRGIKRRAVCQPMGGPPHKQPSSPPSPSITEPFFPVPAATRGPEPTPSSEQTSPVSVATRGAKRRVELLPVGGSPKKPKIGSWERQSVPLAERVQTRSMTKRGPQPSSSTELTLPVPLATRGTKRRTAKVGGSPLKEKSPESLSSTEPTSPVSVASRGVKRRTEPGPVGGSPKRSKKTESSGADSATTRDIDANTFDQLAIAEQSSASSDETCKLSQQHSYHLRPRSKVEKKADMGLFSNCPIRDNKAEALKLSHGFNLRPRQKLSRKVDQKKDRLPKNRRVPKEPHINHGDHISGSETLESLKNNPEICPLTYLASFRPGNLRDGSYKIPHFAPIPQSMWEKIGIPLDSLMFI